MVFQIAAVLWSIIGFFSNSIILFSAGAVICIILNIIQLLSKQANPIISLVLYSTSIAFSGSISGVLLAGIVLCTISIVKPRLIQIYSSTPKQT